MQTEAKTRRMTLRIPADVRQWIYKKADTQGITNNALVSLIIQKEMEKEKGEAPA